MPENKARNRATSTELFEEEIADLERPIVHSWAAVLGSLALGIVLGGIMVGFFYTNQGTDRGPKTNTGLPVLTLGEPQGQVTGSPEMFRWEPFRGATKYVVTVIEEKFDRTILVRPIHETQLVPTTDESDSFRPGLYVWSVEAQTDDATTLAQGEGAFIIVAAPIEEGAETTTGG